jgi:hypothetical protein
MKTDFIFYCFQVSIGFYLFTFFISPIFIQFYFSDAISKLIHLSTNLTLTQKICIHLGTSNLNESRLPILMKYWRDEFIPSDIFDGFYFYPDDPPINSSSPIRTTNLHDTTGKDTLYWKFYQSILDFLYSNSFDWANRAIDDTFLNMSLLTKFLNSRNTVYHSKSDVVVKGYQFFSFIHG